jgi:hypothetical protein
MRRGYTERSDNKGARATGKSRERDQAIAATIPERECAGLLGEEGDVRT